MLFLIYLYIFCSFVCFLLSKGLKFKAHTLMWGLANLHSSLNVMKSFCWFKPCVPNCMYIPLSMLWILTVHKKIWRKFCCWMHFRQPWRKERKKSHKLSHCVRFISQNAHRCWQNFAAVYKRFNTICIWWLVVVLLKHRPVLCLSLPQSEMYLVNAFRCVLPGLTSYQPQ